MSLKFLHQVIIFAAIAVALVFAGWCFTDPTTVGDPRFMIAGGICIAVAVGLVFYEIHFSNAPGSLSIDAMKLLLRLFLTGGLLLGAANSRTLACAACYSSNTGSRMGQAANVGVIVMAVIMFVMLGVLFAAGCYLNYRAKHPLPDYNDLLTEDEITPEGLPDAS